MKPTLLVLLAGLAGSVLLPAGARVSAQAAAGPSARLVPAPVISLPGPSDSNSPALWELIGGQFRLFLFTSVAGQATRHSGLDLTRLHTLGDVEYERHPGHGVWLEAVIADVDGSWYGFYHNEHPADICNDDRTIPRIGAVRSIDLGATWDDLGTVLEAPPNSHDCASTNRYFLGGVGDFTVALDEEARYLYFFFSQYARRESSQGVSVARLPWADRDAPTGRASVWLRNQTWLPARAIATESGMRFIYPGGSPIYRVGDGWHEDSVVDAFWGPSVHWNTYLSQYVMLLNRARDTSWAQEGVYVAFAPTLDDPTAWSTPQRLLSGGRWYPQVLGLDGASGTDKQAGERARFFMGGRSEYLIQFSR